MFVGDKLVEDVIGPKCMGMKAFLRRLPTGETSMGGYVASGGSRLGVPPAHDGLIHRASEDPPVYDGVIFDLSTIIEVLKAI